MGREARARRSPDTIRKRIQFQREMACLPVSQTAPRLGKPPFCTGFLAFDGRHLECVVSLFCRPSIVRIPSYQSSCQWVGVLKGTLALAGLGQSPLGWSLTGRLSAVEISESVTVVVQVKPGPSRLVIALVVPVGFYYYYRRLLLPVLTSTGSTCMTVTVPVTASSRTVQCHWQ